MVNYSTFDLGNEALDSKMASMGKGINRYYEKRNTGEKMNVLVLGATGFIGGHIARAALELGWCVRGLRRRPDSVGDLAGLQVEWVNGDLSKPKSLQTAMQNVEIVFHAAAYYPHGGRPSEVPSQVKTAEEEISAVIEAVRTSEVRRLIYTSSLTTIGHPPPEEMRLADERDIYIPGTLAKSGYYEAKIVMENAVLAAVSEGMDAVVLCPTAVFGPGDVHLTLGKMLIAVANGKVPAWLPGDINVIDVREVGAAHIAAAVHGRKGERYILGGHNFTIREALDEAARAAGVNAPRFEIPLWIIEGLTSLGDALPFLGISGNHMRALKYWQDYNTGKAERELGLKPRPFAETVGDALNWLSENELM